MPVFAWQRRSDAGAIRQVDYSIAPTECQPACYACLLCKKAYNSTSAPGSIRARYCSECFDRLAHPAATPSSPVVIPAGVGPVRGPFLRAPRVDLPKRSPVNVDRAWAGLCAIARGASEEEASLVASLASERADRLPGGEAAAAAAVGCAGLSPAHIPPLLPDGPVGRKLGGISYNSSPDSRVSSVCGVRYAINGNIAKLFLPTAESKCPGVKRPVPDVVRGDIGEFSRESRRRFLNLLNSIDREKIPADNICFMTLTYHEKWGRDFEEWKRDIETWWKRFEREYREEYGVEVNGELAAASLIWKLEYQKRGAPHFHCLLLWLGNRPNLPALREWVAQSWNDVVDPGNAAHLAAGTQCDLAKKWGGVSSYAAKYCGKQTNQLIDQDTGEVHKNGRWWGVKHRRALPIRFEEQGLTEEQALTVRRVLQKKSISEAATAENPHWKMVKWRKNRRGAKMADEVFYIEDGQLQKLLAWVRQERGCEWMAENGMPWQYSDLMRRLRVEPPSGDEVAAATDEVAEKVWRSGPVCEEVGQEEARAAMARLRDQGRKPVRRRWRELTTAEVLSTL
jgi:hypothetical protein